MPKQRLSLARLSLSFFLLFGLAEALLSVCSFSNPESTSVSRILEAPISLLFLLLGLHFALVALGRRPKLQLLLGGAVIVLICAAIIPVTPPKYTNYRIEVSKHSRQLRVWHKDGILGEYEIGLGNPLGDKVVVGDGKTPLGEFRIVDKAPSEFHLWLGLNYPTTEDAWRGRSSGKITWLEYWYIRVENLNGRIPYSSSALGGAVGIHGGGADNDWTLGCVALSNSDIKQLYGLVPVGTRVSVYP